MCFQLCASRNGAFSQSQATDSETQFYKLVGILRLSFSESHLHLYFILRKCECIRVGGEQWHTYKNTSFTA